MPSHPEMSMEESFSASAIPTPALGSDACPSSTVPQTPPQYATIDFMLSELRFSFSMVGNLIKDEPFPLPSFTLNQCPDTPLPIFTCKSPFDPSHRSNSAMELPSSVIPLEQATTPRKANIADKLRISFCIRLILFPCQWK